MKPLIILILCVQAAIVLATVAAVVFRKPTAARPGPIWSSLAVSLFTCALASFAIADNHRGAAGVEVAELGGAVLLGLGLGMGLVALRARRSQPVP